ncbi:hypothetical protein [Shinella sp. DD12]|uniref:hypothetical protein n=1 Tax=Shinella sp. DD12 TaxID=1410620 RepID=UPI0003C5583B|nr:hypothetical protein [Shinella sp. DD12]EYR81811.1 hypothetical protein SHLA_4c001020 [Shinella sp. DD12]
MFGLIEKAVRVTANVVTLPVSLAADAVTLGGELNDRRQSYTGSKLKRIGRDASDIVEDVAG